MRATGVNPATPLRLAATQASFVFSFFSVPSAPLWLRGARAPFAGPCPSRSCSLPPPCCCPGFGWTLWAEGIGLPPIQMQQEKGDDSAAESPKWKVWCRGGGRCAGRARAEGLPPPLALAGSARPQHGFTLRSQLALESFSAWNCSLHAVT